MFHDISQVLLVEMITLGDMVALKLNQRSIPYLWNTMFKHAYLYTKLLTSFADLESDKRPALEECLFMLVESIIDNNNNNKMSEFSSNIP